MLRSLKIAACGIGATLLAAGVAFSDEVVIGAALPLTARGCPLRELGPLIFRKKGGKRHLLGPPIMNHRTPH